MKLPELIKIAKKEAPKSVLAWVKGYLYKEKECQNSQIKK